MPVNATGARLLWGSKENALPTIYYDEPLNNKTIALGDDIPDGTYYFHVQSRDAGGWSNVAHFQFNVDRTPPDSLGIQCFGDSGVCSASFRVNAHDETAGISHFLMQIDNQEPELWRDYGGSHIWKPPSLRAGTHILQVTAVDAAGNSIEKKVQFESVATFPLVSSWSLSLRNSQIAGLLFIAAGLILAVLVFTKKRRRYFAPVSANQSRRSTTAQAGRLALRMVLLPLVWVLRQGGSVAYAGGRALRAILLSLWQVLRFALLGGEAAHAIGRALRAILLSLWHVLRFALRMALLLLVWLIRTGFYLYHRGWRRKAAYAKKKITKPRINV
ncbi:MAG: hypothetical protein HYT46_03845 [Candidatus Vogelbacteria bacterium]|nr:hypothetical protein [Candidatus Vogelbacteria bacterium]